MNIVSKQLFENARGINNPGHEFSAGIKYTRTGIVLQEELPMADCRSLS